MAPGKPGRSSFGYLVLVVIVVLAAWYFLRPLGLQVSAVFQTLVDAFKNR
jgi:hypothetical protein